MVLGFESSNNNHVEKNIGQVFDEGGFAGLKKAFLEKVEFIKNVQFYLELRLYGERLKLKVDELNALSLDDSDDKKRIDEIFDEMSAFLLFDITSIDPVMESLKKLDNNNGMVGAFFGNYFENIKLSDQRLGYLVQSLEQFNPVTDKGFLTAEERQTDTDYTLLVKLMMQFNDDSQMVAQKVAENFWEEGLNGEKYKLVYDLFLASRVNSSGDFVDQAGIHTIKSQLEDLEVDEIIDYVNSGKEKFVEDIKSEKVDARKMELIKLCFENEQGGIILGNILDLGLPNELIDEVLLLGLEYDPELLLASMDTIDLKNHVLGDDIAEALIDFRIKNNK